MKKTSIRTLYHLFAFLSDKTNGFAPFVKYKISLGVLLIGISTNSCKKMAPTCYIPAFPIKENTLSLSEKNVATTKEEGVKFIPSTSEIIPNELIMCYDQVDPMYVEPEEPAIYTIVEEMPSFPGGNKALMKFLSDNLHYPKVDDETPIPGRVVLRFVVRATGKIDNIEVVKSISPSFDEEAVRVINSMPQWIPGKQSGKPVDVYYSLPIHIEIDRQ